MAKLAQADLEFERNKAAILEMNACKGKHPSVWDFEIDAHRKRQKLDRFLMFGAFCGIFSLIGTLYMIYNFYG